MTFTHSKKHRARKTHACDLCADTIQPGDTYERVFDVDGGDVVSWKCCAICSAWSAALWRHHPDIAAHEGCADLVERLGWARDEIEARDNT